MIVLAAVAVLAGVPPAMAQETPATPHVQVRLTPERTDVGADETFYIAIEQTIEPGWHTYWANPGDSGEAPTLTWTMPAGFEAGAIEWPLPKKISVGPLANYG